MRIAAAVGVLALPVLLLGLALWVNLVLRPRRRAFIAEHPEQRPYGRRLLLRVSPFIVLGLVFAVMGLVTHDWLLAVLGALSSVGLLFEVWRRRRPPIPTKQMPG